MPERKMARTVSKQWAIDVAMRMKDAKFPLYKEDVRTLLEGLDIGDTSCSLLLDGMDYPVTSPVQLLHEIAKQTCLSSCPPEEAWTVKVTNAMEDMTFPATLEEAHEKLDGIDVGGQDISELLEKIDYPVESPSDLLKRLAELV